MDRSLAAIILLVCVLATLSTAAPFIERIPRIVNGSEATANQFPYMVSLRLKAENMHFCGGAILNNRWILSATHCTNFTPHVNINVVVGALHRVYGGVPHDIEKVIEHDFSWDTLENDICVIKTKTTIEYSPAVQPIAFSRDYFDSGAQSVVSGWGLIQPMPEGIVFPEILQWLPKRTVSNEECKAALSKTPARVFDSTLCAISTRPVSGVCNTDSGGPLVADNQIIGVVSFGIPPCGSGLFPDGYARVSFYYDWIVENMRNN